MKKIGLVGGIGPASTIDYYNGLIKITRDTFGEKIYPPIVIDSVDLHTATEYYVKSEWQNSADLMIESINNLARAGAKIAAITANTEHIVWNLMEKRFPIPVVSILDAVAREIQNSGCKKVFVLGTEFTMSTKLYDNVLKQYGITAISPTESEIKVIGNLIYPNLENGILIEKDKEKMLEIINSTILKTGADSVLLGCTELPIMIKPQDLTIPVFNSTELHIKAIFEASCK